MIRGRDGSGFWHADAAAGAISPGEPVAPPKRARGQPGRGKRGATPMRYQIAARHWGVRGGTLGRRGRARDRAVPPLSTREEASRRDYRPLYLLVEDGLGPLAAVVAERTDRFWRPGSGWRNEVLRRLLLKIRPALCCPPERHRPAPGRGAGRHLARSRAHPGRGLPTRGAAALEYGKCLRRRDAGLARPGLCRVPRPPTMVIDLPVDSYEAD